MTDRGSCVLLSAEVGVIPEPLVEAEAGEEEEEGEREQRRMVLKRASHSQPCELFWSSSPLRISLTS